MQRTNIYLEERQTAALDELARRNRTTRAHVIRGLIDEGLRAGPGDDEADLGVIAASFGVCAGAEEIDGGREGRAREEHLARLWAG